MSKELRALIVEDEAIIALSLRRTLAEAGFEVCGTVAKGEDAVRVAEETQPAVVVMDILLAGALDGIEAARRIMQKTDVPIVFTTGYQDSEIRDRAMELHPVGFLKKPIDNRALLALLERVRLGTTP